MKGVSEVIAIILILMITISLAGLAYMFMSTTMSDVTSSASSTVDTTTSSMLTSFVIESMSINKLYVRNTGQTSLTSLSVYSGDAPVRFNMTPSSIASGEVGSILINDFIRSGDVIKVSSAQGFSASKIAQNQCGGALLCWRLDEGTGSVVQDSSGSVYSGNLTNGPSWTLGRFGNALSFDGINDYVDFGDIDSLETGSITISLWIKPAYFNSSGYNEALRKESSGGFHIGCSSCGGGGSWYMGFKNSTGTDTYIQISHLMTPLNQWTHIALSIDGATIRAFINGNLNASATLVGGSRGTGSNRIYLGGYGPTLPRTFNGTIDDVRFYDRALTSQEISNIYNTAAY